MKITLSLSIEGKAATFCETSAKRLSGIEKVLLYLGKLIGVLIVTAVLAVIPLLHLFVVLGGLVSFIYIAVTALRASPKFQDTQGLCPNCGSTFLIFRKPLAALPYEQECDHCHQLITVKLNAIE